MATLHKFSHEPPVKASCCNNPTSTTYWMAKSREAAKEEIREETDDHQEAHGLCGRDMADLLATEGYQIKRGESQ